MSAKKRKIFFSSPAEDTVTHEVAQAQKDILKSLIAQGTIVNGEHYLPASWWNNTSDDAFNESIVALDEANILVAEVNEWSHSVGREIAYAQFVRKIPVLCLYKRGTKPSAMIEGNEELQVFPYETAEDIKGIVDNFFTHWLE